MSFVRPEARAAIWRMREVLAGLVLLLLALWCGLNAGGVLWLFALAFGLGGVSLVWIGLQRLRFRGEVGGVGVVQVDEGEITYFGPLSGGSVSVLELRRLILDRSGMPGHWRLEQAGQAPLMIPLDATGTDLLFDAFSALPGLNTKRMLTALEAEGTDSVVIWEREPGAAIDMRLH